MSFAQVKDVVHAAPRLSDLRNNQPNNKHSVACVGAHYCHIGAVNMLASFGLQI
jgi:hypothetical protein